MGGVPQASVADEALQEEIVKKYMALSPALLSYALRVLRTLPEAEDVVQVTFMRLFDAQQKKEPINNLRAWLYRVAHNLAIDQLRSRNRREALSTKSELFFSRQQVEESAEKNLIEKQEIAAVLSRLNEREKHCLLLRAEGLSYEEIGNVVGISAKAVSVYLVRGLKKARETV